MDMAKAEQKPKEGLLAADLTSAGACTIGRRYRVCVNSAAPG
jgi:hypothetical protein